MTLFVRLIGGPNHGEVTRIDDDQSEVVAHKDHPSQAARAFKRNFGMNSATVEVKRTRYTRRLVSTPDGSIVYFADEVLSDLEALAHVLGA